MATHQKTDSERLARIETLLEQLVGNGKPGLCSTHSDRIRKLEIWRGWMTGALALLGVMVTTAAVVMAGWKH